MVQRGLPSCSVPDRALRNAINARFSSGVNRAGLTSGSRYGFALPP